MTLPADTTQTRHPQAVQTIGPGWDCARGSGIMGWLAGSENSAYVVFITMKNARI